MNDRWLCGPAVAAAAAVLAAGMPAAAQNAAFQGFFFDVCGNPTGALAARCAETPSGAGALSSNSQTSLNPAQTATGTDAALSRARGLLTETQDRMEERRTEEKKEARLQRLGVAAGQDGEADFGRWGTVFNLRGERFDRDRDPGDREIGYDGHAWAAEVGVDYRFSERLVLGALFGYQRTDSEFDPEPAGVAFTPAADRGDTETDSMNLTLFATYSLTDAWYLEGTAGFGYSDYSFTRRAVFQETTRATPQTNVLADGDSDGTEWSFSVGTGYDFYQGAVGFGPYARLNYVRTHIDGYTESDRSGSGLAMRVGNSRATSLASVLGVQASYAASTDFGVLVPQVRAEYEHEFKDDPRTVTSRYVNDAAGTPFGVRGDSPDRNYFNAGASLLLILPNGIMPYVDVETLLGYDDFRRHRLTLGLRLEW